MTGLELLYVEIGVKVKLGKVVTLGVVVAAFG